MQRRISPRSGLPKHPSNNAIIEEMSDAIPPTLPEYMRSPTWYGEQDENGVDLSLIRENLKLTPEERLRNGDAHAASTRRLMEHARTGRQEHTSAVR